MKFNILTESEMILKAKAGHHAYLDLLLSNYEQFLLQHISKTAMNTAELLAFRQGCIQYVYTHFHDQFDQQKHPDFAAWLLECVENVRLKK